MIEAEIRAVQYPLMGVCNGNKESTIKGKDAAAVHLNNFCQNKNFIQAGQTFKDVEPSKAIAVGTANKDKVGISHSEVPGKEW